MSHIFAVRADDWLCMRHCCLTCGEAAAVMCVFCPTSYCDLHAVGKIKTCSFAVSNGSRVRHRVCVSHKSMQSKIAKDQRRRRRLQTASVHTSDRDDKTDSTVAEHVVAPDNCHIVEEHTGVSPSVGASPAELSLRKREGGGVIDAGVTARREPASAKRRVRIRPTGASNKLARSSRHRPRLRVKIASRQPKRDLVAAAKLHGKNGIVFDVLDTGILRSQSPVEEHFPSQNEKPDCVHEMTELTAPSENVEKSPSKRRSRTPVVNGFRGPVTVTTRRRPTLQENSQTMNIPASKLETAVSEIVAATFLEDIDLKLVNGKELLVDD